MLGPCGQWRVPMGGEGSGHVLVEGNEWVWDRQ